VNGLFEWNFGDTEIIMLVWATLGLVFAVRRHGAGVIVAGGPAAGAGGIPGRGAAGSPAGTAT
jgi:hypothetical protein